MNFAYRSVCEIKIMLIFASVIITVGYINYAIFAKENGSNVTVNIFYKVRTILIPLTNSRLLLW